jgi:hypothetical protein
MRISPKARDVVMNLSLLLLSFIGIAKYLNVRAKHLIHYHKNSAIMLGCILLMLLLVVSIDRKIDSQNVRCRRGFVIGWLLCFGMAFIMTFIHPVTKGYFLWTVISLIFAIPFAMIWSERGDFDYLCDILARNVLIAVVVFILMNLTLTPFITYTGAGDYLGVAANANNNGFMCTAGYTAALYKLLHDRKHHVLYAIIMGFCIAITVASICRTGELAIIAETLAGLIYFFGIVKTTGEDAQLSKLVISAVIILLIAYTARPFLIRLDQTDLNSYALTGDGAVAEETQGQDIHGTIDAVSSGRVSIWKAYISNSTFWGNGNKTKGPQLEGNADSRYAHNNAIEVLFVSGFIAFAGYVIWIISGLVFVIRCLMGKFGWHKSYILVIMAFTGYFIQAMLEILIYPMNNIPALMMYVCLMPIVLDMREEDTVE